MILFVFIQFFIWCSVSNTFWARHKVPPLQTTIQPQGNTDSQQFKWTLSQSNFIHRPLSVQKKHNVFTECKTSHVEEILEGWINHENFCTFSYHNLYLNHILRLCEEAGIHGKTECMHRKNIQNIYRIWLGVTLRAFLVEGNSAKQNVCFLLLL